MKIHDHSIKHGGGDKEESSSPTILQDFVAACVQAHTRPGTPRAPPLLTISSSCSICCAPYGKGKAMGIAPASPAPLTSTRTETPRRREGS